jgi:hypothetical protein
MKNKLSTPREIFIAIIINLLSNGIFLLFQSFGSQPLELQVPMWIFVLFVGVTLTITYFLILRIKVDPFLELIDDLEICIEDFKRFFNHPNWAIMPNPFSSEPEFWKYYENSFSFVLKSWYLNLERRFKKQRKDVDDDLLIEYSTEFCEIVNQYLTFSKVFQKLTEKHPISENIRLQYNTSFVNEFNTIFRLNLINYLKKLERITSKRIEKSDIKPATPLD